jgi:hypothetical protein
MGASAMVVRSENLVLDECSPGQVKAEDEVLSTKYSRVHYPLQQLFRQEP